MSRTKSTEPELPWDTTPPEERLAVLRGAFLGCSTRRRDILRALPPRLPDRGEDHSETKTRIQGRWAARTAMLVEQGHEEALVEQERRRTTASTVRPIKGWKESGR